MNCYVESNAVDCEFGNIGSFGYQCYVKSIKITSKDNRTITNVTGDHQYEKSNNDVMFFNSQNHIMQFFPLELTKFFNNLKSVRIVTANMSEINCSDLKQFGENLTRLFLSSNVIKILEKDLFKFNKNLTSIDFYRNKLTKIHDGVFDGLNLTSLYLNDNPCINEYADNGTDVVAFSKRAYEQCSGKKDPTIFLIILFSFIILVPLGLFVLKKFKSKFM